MNVIKEWPILLIIFSSLSVTFCSAAAHTFHSRYVMLLVYELNDKQKNAFVKNNFLLIKKLRTFYCL